MDHSESVNAESSITIRFADNEADQESVQNDAMLAPLSWHSNWRNRRLSSGFNWIWRPRSPLGSGTEAWWSLCRKHIAGMGRFWPVQLRSLQCKSVQLLVYRKFWITRTNIRDVRNTFCRRIVVIQRILSGWCGSLWYGWIGYLGFRRPFRGSTNTKGCSKNGYCIHASAVTRLRQLHRMLAKDENACIRHAKSMERTIEKG